MAEPLTLAEALEEIQRLRALGDRLAGTLELVTADLHMPIAQKRAVRDTERAYVCIIQNPDQMDVIAAPVHEWLVATGMKPDELRREKASVAAEVARAE